LGAIKRLMARINLVYAANQHRPPRPPPSLSRGHANRARHAAVRRGCRGFGTALPAHFAPPMLFNNGEIKYKRGRAPECGAIAVEHAGHDR